MSFEWTEDKREELKRLWADKALSVAEIGRLVGCGKNAASGMAYRLGLGPRPCPQRVFKQGSQAPGTPGYLSARMKARVPQLVALIAREARAGRPAPSNGALAEPMAVQPSAIAAMLAHAQAAGLLRVECAAHGRIFADAGGAWRTAEPAAYRPPRSHSAAAIAHAQQLRLAPPEPPPAPEPAPQPERAPPLSAPRIIPQGVSHRRCQWPLGEPRKPGFRFCEAAPVLPGKPYCAEHCAQAFVTLPSEATLPSSVARLLRLGRAA